MVSDYLVKNPFDATKIADILAQHAYKLSLDERYKSPFAIEAIKAGKYFTGGKSDDITVVVGKVRLVETANNDL